MHTSLASKEAGRRQRKSPLAVLLSQPGSSVPFVVRWDFDPVKGPHVNVSIGKGDTQTKFAVQSDLSAGEGDPNYAKKQMVKVMKEMNEAAGGYDRSLNTGKSEPTFPNGQTEAETIAKLQDYFNSVSSGPC